MSAASDANLASNNCASCSLDGTSMSAPAAAGLAALVREYYATGFLAAGTRNPAQGFSPSGALVKATLIDGAVALGAQAPGPANRHGRADAELARFIAGGVDNAAIAEASSDNDGQPAKFGVAQEFHRHVERVEVDVEDRGLVAHMF